MYKIKKSFMCGYFWVSFKCHPRAWLLARPEDLDSRVKPENDKDVVKSIFPKKNDHNNLRPQCASDTTGFLSDVYKRGRRARKFLADGAQCGRSMIEMLGVLAIIGVLSVGGIAGYSKAMMQFKINKTKQQIAEVVFNIRSMYAQQNPKDYSGLYVDSLPEDFGKAFGGYAEFNSRPNGYLEPGRFSISLFGLPMEACVALATTNWGTDETTGFVGMSILSASAGYGYIYIGCKGEGEGSNNAFYYACSGSLPLSPSVASKYCARSHDGSLYLSFH